MTHEAIQFPKADRVGFGSTSPSCLTGIQVRVMRLSRIMVVALRKRAGRKDFWRASSTGRQASPTPGFTRLTKYHSCWRDFFRPEYDVCGCRRATPYINYTDVVRPRTFYSIHAVSSYWYLMKPPK